MAHLLQRLYTVQNCLNSITFFRERHTARMAKMIQGESETSEESPSLTVLLLSDDEALTDFVVPIVKRPWKLVRRGAGYMSREIFTQPSVRLVILDDQAVEENDRGWLLAQIGRHFSGTSLLYVAGSQSDGNEKRARANGAQYYASKPLSPERFGHVLQSFLQAQQSKR